MCVTDGGNYFGSWQPRSELERDTGGHVHTVKVCPLKVLVFATDQLITIV